MFNRRGSEAPRPPREEGAGTAGPFDRIHGSELVEELPGHAVASRMHPDRENRLSGYEVYFLVAGADFPLGSLEGGVIASSFFFAISA
jgi:hypothetical protein